MGKHRGAKGAGFHHAKAIALKTGCHTVLQAKPLQLLAAAPSLLTKNITRSAWVSFRWAATSGLACLVMLLRSVFKTPVSL